MTEEEKARDDKARKDAEDKARDDKARKDAEEKEKADSEMADKILRGIDSLRQDMESVSKRMDAWEEEDKKKADAAKKDGEGEGEDPEKEKAERLAADKAKKDAEEKEEEMKKADAARADASETRIKDLEAKIAAMAAKIPAQPSDDDYHTLIGYQARADDVFSAHGERAPRPQVGETPMMYRRRVAGMLRKHSANWKDVTLDTMPEEAFVKIEAQVYADAATAARTPNNVAKGQMRERVTQRNGHTITEFFGGDGTHFVKQFGRPARRVKNFRIAS